MVILLSTFLDVNLVKHLLDVLKVGHISAGSHDGVLADWMEALDVLEACEGAIRCW